MQQGSSFAAHREELEKLPLSFQEEFQRAEETLSFIFKDDEMASWARETMAISTRTPRSWEAGIEYLKASGEVAKYLSFASFTQWTRCGAYLSQDSPTLAVAYFRASPAIVVDLRPQHIARWAALGRSLYKGTWKSSTLAAKFFETSPTLVKNLSFWDVEVCANLIEALSAKSYDVATECLVIGSDVLPRMSREREPFLALCRTLTDTGWREVKACFQVVGRALPQVEENQRSRFLRLADHLAREGSRETSVFIVSGSAALGKIRPQAQQHVLDLCDNLMTVSPPAVHALLNSLESVLARITLPQLDAWFDQGMRLIHENPDGGLAYFKVESSTSEGVIDSLSSSLELERVKGILMLYCRALSGADIEVTESGQLVHKGIGWVSEGHAHHRRHQGVPAPNHRPLRQQGRKLRLVQGRLHPPGGSPGVRQLPLRVRTPLRPLPGHPSGPGRGSSVSGDGRRGDEGLRPWRRNRLGYRHFPLLLPPQRQEAGPGPLHHP